MQKLILNIEDSRYQLLLQFLKTLDYVQIVHSSDSPHVTNKNGISDDAQPIPTASPIYWLEQLAHSGSFESIDNPVEWQRAVRADRELPR
ncbi:MAG: hypothetical protein ACKV1O_12255 [Saprospiraceae bacterium]